MTQLQLLKELLGSPQVSDDLLNFYLDCAKDLICEIRNSLEVESQYSKVQIEIAIEMFNKRGVEGQNSHSENGINRGYETSNISPSLLSKITPMARTPFSTVRVV